MDMLVSAGMRWWTYGQMGARGVVRLAAGGGWWL